MNRRFASRSPESLEAIAVEIEPPHQPVAAFDETTCTRAEEGVHQGEGILVVGVDGCEQRAETDDVEPVFQGEAIAERTDAAAPQTPQKPAAEVDFAIDLLKAHVTGEAVVLAAGHDEARPATRGDFTAEALYLRPRLSSAACLAIGNVAHHLRVGDQFGVAVEIIVGPLAQYDGPDPHPDDGCDSHRRFSLKNSRT